MEEIPNKSSSRGIDRKNLVFTIFVVCAIGYIIFLLYQAVYFNYSTNQKIKDLKAEQEDLLKDKSRLETLIAYYKTDAFAELEARKKLGLKKPGEIVVRVDIPSNANTDTKPINSVAGSKVSNFQSWIDYIIGR